jgi:hypothetical protein
MSIISLAKCSTFAILSPQMKYKKSIFIYLILIGIISIFLITAKVKLDKDRSEAIAKFNMELNDDLKTYLSDKYSPDTHFKYELLREGPTITGVAMPKYYIWVTVYNKDNSIIEQGAMRIADDRDYFGHFSITDFLLIEEVRSNHRKIYKIFPEPVGQKIEAKL